MKDGYVPEHKETGLRSRTQRNRATFQNTKKKNTRLTKKRKAEPYTGWLWGENIAIPIGTGIIFQPTLSSC